LKKAIAVLIVLVGTISTLTGCNKVASAPELEAKQMMDISQYSRITLDELLTKLGEPLREDELIFKSPNGKEYPAMTYIFEIDHYPFEFIAVENTIVGLNLLNLENEEYKLKVDSHKEVLGLTGIIPGEDMVTLVEDAVTARYSSVNDTVDEVWATMDNKSVDLLRVTFETEYIK